MANNLSSLYEDIFTLMLDPLRANSITPRLLTSEYSEVAAEKGQKISVPMTPDLSVSDVTPGAVPPQPADMTPSAVDVDLEFWRSSQFQLSDKDKYDIREGNLPKVFQKAISVVVDNIDATILTAMGEGASYATGTAGTAPFATATLALQANRILNKNKASKMDRHVLFDADAEVNLLSLNEFSNSQFTGDFQAMVEGNFDGNRRLGAQWWQNQNTPTHTKGTANSSYVTNGALSVGDTAITVDTGTGTMVAGDVITFAADSVNKYVVAEDFAGGAGTVTIAGGLLAEIPDNNWITVAADHVGNVAFTSDSVAFASRPLPASDASAMTDTLVDPISGVALRLETLRGWQQDIWVVSALWGAKVVQPAGVVKILG